MKKMIITFLILGAIMYGFICLADSRTRKIDNGEMILVSQREK